METVQEVLLLLSQHFLHSCENIVCRLTLYMSYTGSVKYGNSAPFTMHVVLVQAELNAHAILLSENITPAKRV